MKSATLPSLPPFAPRPTAWDGVLLLLLLAVLALPLIPGRPAGTPGLVEVLTPAGGRSYPLASDGRYPVRGPLGEATLVVRGGKVTLENPPCPEKVCERMGPAEKPGDLILCAPNRIMVRIPGSGGPGGKEGVDAVAR